MPGVPACLHTRSHFNGSLRFQPRWDLSQLPSALGRVFSFPDKRRCVLCIGFNPGGVEGRVQLSTTAISFILYFSGRTPRPPGAFLVWFECLDSLTMKPRQVPNSEFSCRSFLNAGFIGLHHGARPPGYVLFEEVGMCSRQQWGCEG